MKQYLASAVLIATLAQPAHAVTFPTLTTNLCRLGRL
jgi:hypothetical protein